MRAIATRRGTSDVVVAAIVGGAFGGIPSTAHALATQRPVLQATRAAGDVIGRPSAVRGAVAHAVISLWWALVLAKLLPERRQVAWGGAAGLSIAGADLAIAARCFPTIAALPRVPQVADHLAFGLLVGVVFACRDRSHPEPGAGPRVVLRRPR